MYASSSIAYFNFAGANLGVGTTSPTSLLSVQGNSVTSGMTTSGGFYATSTLRVNGLVNCDTVDTDAEGNFKCGTDATGGGGSFEYDWLKETDGFGVTALTPTTTLPIWIKSTATSTIAGSLQALGGSFTSYLEVPFFNATSTATSTIRGGLQLGTVAGDNKLKITADRNYSNSTSVGGLLNLTNTNSTGTGLVIYSNAGATANGRSIVVRQDNAANPQQAVFIQNDGTSSGLVVDCNTTSGVSECVNIDSTDADKTVLGVSGAPNGLGVVKATATGGNSSTAVFSLRIDDDDAQGLFIDTQATYDGKLLNLRSNGTELLTFTAPDGFLGVGTTSPGVPLDVKGRLAATSVYTGEIYATTTPSSATGNALCFNSTTGAFSASGANDCTVSSARFKDKIENLKLDSDKLGELTPRSFTWKTDGSPSFGLIAEEVENIYPELVTYDPDGKPASVKYDLLSVLLLDYLQTHDTTMPAQGEGFNVAWLGLLGLLGLIPRFRRR